MIAGKIIIDTNVLSEVMRPKPNERVLHWMDAAPRSELRLTSIVVAEILYGIGALPAGKRRQSLLTMATAMFEEDFKGKIFSFDHFAAVEYADIVIRRERLGSPISMADAQIAAICRANKSNLATRNIRDFQETQVELINPWEV